MFSSQVSTDSFLPAGISNLAFPKENVLLSPYLGLFAEQFPEFIISNNL